jgi:hypothetical protein
MMGNSLQPTVVGRLSLVLSPKGDPNGRASTMAALLTKYNIFSEFIINYNPQNPRYYIDGHAHPPAAL